jgi:hypothetical protein
MMKNLNLVKKKEADNYFIRNKSVYKKTSINLIDKKISDLTGDEPDDSYYDNGPEQEKYYFEEVK